MANLSRAEKVISHNTQVYDSYTTIGYDDSSLWVLAMPGNGIIPTKLHFAGARAFTRFLFARKCAGQYYDTKSGQKYNFIDEASLGAWPFYADELLNLLKISGLEVRIDQNYLSQVNSEHGRISARYSRCLPKIVSVEEEVEWEYEESTIDSEALQYSTNILRKQGWEELLFPFAFKSACEIATKKDVLLAIFMGGGKTRLALALSEYWREVDSLSGPTIIIALKRHFVSWREELEKLTILQGAYSGDLFEEWFASKRPSFDRPFLFLSLERLNRLEKSQLNLLYEKAKQSTIILDESYTISNRGTERTRRMMPLRGAHHISCSGTPIRSFVTQLLPVLQWTFRGGSLALPDYPENRSYGNTLFEKRFVSFAQASDGSTKRIPYINNLDALHELLAPLMYRRVRNEPDVVRDLGEANIEIEWVDVKFDDDHAELYELVLEKFILWYERQLLQRGIESLPSNEILVKLTYLLTVISSPWKVTDKGDDEFVWPALERKATSLIRSALDIALREINDGHICIIFGYTVDSVLLVYEELKRLGITSLCLHGGISVERRTPIIREFQRGGAQVLVGTYGVLMESLNLGIADRAIIMETTWVPSTISQALGRITRGVQENIPRAYFLRIPGTIQEYQLNWCTLKQHSINAAIDKTRQVDYSSQIYDFSVFINVLISDLLKAKKIGRNYQIIASKKWATKIDEISKVRDVGDI